MMLRDPNPNKLNKKEIRDCLTRRTSMCSECKWALLGSEDVPCKSCAGFIGAKTCNFEEFDWSTYSFVATEDVLEMRIQELEYLVQLLVRRHGV
jgi:hypothetical protein